MGKSCFVFLLEWKEMLNDQKNSKESFRIKSRAIYINELDKCEKCDAISILSLNSSFIRMNCLFWIHEENSGHCLSNKLELCRAKSKPKAFRFFWAIRTKASRLKTIDQSSKFRRNNNSLEEWAWRQAR